MSFLESFASKWPESKKILEEFTYENELTLNLVDFFESTLPHLKFIGI